MLKKIFVTALLLSGACGFAQSQNLKWEEGFDSLSIYSKGWTLINRDSSAVVPAVVHGFTFVNLGYQSAKNGNNFFKFSFEDCSYQNYADDWLISPKLRNIAAGDTISFWCGAVDGTQKDSLRIWISTADSLPGSFGLIDYFKATGPVGAWHKKSYDLSAFAGHDIFFAVNYYIIDGGPLGGSSDNLWIDEFELTGKAENVIVPTSFELKQNFPNPFNPSTQIKFGIPSPSNVTIKIYNSLGMEMTTLVNGYYNKGSYSVNFDARNLASGVYFYKMTAGDFEDTKRMELIK